MILSIQTRNIIAKKIIIEFTVKVHSGSKYEKVKNKIRTKKLTGREKTDSNVALPYFT